MKHYSKKACKIIIKTNTCDSKFLEKHSQRVLGARVGEIFAPRAWIMDILLVFLANDYNYMSIQQKYV